MKFTTVTYSNLPDEAIEIRKRVFMEEQGFEDEFDDTDGIAGHIVLYTDHLYAGTCRFFKSSDRNAWIIGRVAVLKEFRGLHCGELLIAAAEKEIREAGGTCVELSAQCRAAGFYKKQGYCDLEETYLDEGCPHIWMRKELVHAE